MRIIKQREKSQFVGSSEKRMLSDFIKKKWNALKIISSQHDFSINWCTITMEMQHFLERILIAFWAQRNWMLKFILIAIISCLRKKLSTNEFCGLFHEFGERITIYRILVKVHMQCIHLYATENSKWNRIIGIHTMWIECKLKI